MKYFFMYNYLPNFQWELTSSDEMMKLHMSIEGGIKSKISPRLPYWKEAPVFQGKIVHKYSSHPAHLLSDELYEKVVKIPQFLPDILEIFSDVRNVFTYMEGPRFAVSDRLKCILDKSKIAGDFHSFKTEVSFNGEIKIYWILIRYSKEGKMALSDYIDFAKMPVRHKVDDVWVDMEQIKVKDFVKNGGRVILFLGKEKRLYLNDTYDWIFYGGSIYISEVVKNRIEKENILVEIVPMFRLGTIAEIIVPS